MFRHNILIYIFLYITFFSEMSRLFFLRGSIVFVSSIAGFHPLPVSSFIISSSKLHAIILFYFLQFLFLIY